MKTTGIWIFAKMWIVSAVVLAWFWGYSYFVGNKINPEISLLEKIVLWVKHLDSPLEVEKIWFDTQASLEITKWNQKVFSGSLEGKNIAILSQNKGLYQRITADNFSVSYNDTNNYLENLDIISHDTKNYFYAEKIENIFSNKLETYKNILNRWDYIFVDNKKIIENTFENLDKNNIFLQMMIASSTANPQEYLEKNHFKSLVLQELYSDDWIKYLFQKLENSEENLYEFSQNICNDLEKISQNISENNFSVTKSQCENSISQLNFIVALWLNISKTWDVSAGNYTFEISWDEIVKIKAEYKKNILQNWSIYYSQNDILVDIQGNKNKLISSNIDINIQESPDDFITGKITNGSGKITIKTHNNISKIDGEIIFEKYKLFQYDIAGNKKSSRSEMVFSGKWNDHSGELFFEEKTAEKSLWEISLKYNRLNHNFSLTSENINISSVLKNRDFSVSFEEKNVSGEIISQAKIVHNNQVLTGFLKTQDVDITLEWTTQINRIEILKITWDIYGNNILYILEKDDFSKKSAKLAAGATVNDTRFFDLIVQKNTKNLTQEFNQTQFNWKLDIPLFEFSADMDLNISQKNPEIFYSTPKDFQEIQLEFSEIIPVIHIFELWKYNYNFIPEIVITWAWLFGNIWYLDNLKREKNLRNTIASENTKKIFAIIEENILNENINPEDIIWEKKENSENKIRFSGEKIWYSQNYISGKLSEKIIELLWFWENFNADDYQVSIVKNEKQTVIQVASYLEEKPGYKKLFITGNYSPRKIVRYNFSEYIEENKKNKDEENTEFTQNENTKSKISIVWFPHFKVGDMTNIWKITEVKDDFIWIDSQIPNGASKIFLLWDDSPTLFHDEENNVLENNEVFKISQ